jgi:indole-3-acetate monooxygenase
MEGTRLADDSAIQVALAHAEAGVQASRAFVFDALAEAWEALQDRRENSLAQRTRTTMAVIGAMRLCTQAVDAAFHLAGGGALYQASPLQRCFRDIHAAGQHIAFSLETWKRVGKSLLDVEQPTYML